MPDLIKFDEEIAMAQAKKEGKLWLSADLPDWAWRGHGPVLGTRGSFRVRLRVLKYRTVFLGADRTCVGEGVLWGFSRG